MQVKMDDVLIYRDSQVSAQYGTGVVTSVTADEYVILWSGRGLTRYRRSILDGKVQQTFQRLDKESVLPKERRLQLHASKSKAGVPFNENYDRAKLAQLCESLKQTGEPEAIGVAEGLRAELFTKKLVLRGAAKAILSRLAGLCETRSGAACEAARNISTELFFGYVLQKSDFHDPQRER